MRQWLKDNRGFLLFLLGFAFFRTAIADWNPVPTGSMRPTILEGDVVLVDRLAYDAKIPLTDVSVARTGEPRRGEVVTFTSPASGKRLIKRLVGVPGDVIEMRGEVLFLNGEPAQYTSVRELLEEVAPGHPASAVRATETVAGQARVVQYMADRPRRSFGPVVVPAGHYFMLGDNRDNSEDSRFIGFVPRHLLIGHAHRILVSADILDRWRPRFDRVGAPLR